MSLVKAANVQIGTGPSASNNFHWRNLLDGLLRLSRGNAGSPLTDVMRVRADNSVEFPGGYTGSANDEKRRCTAWVNFNGTGTVAIRDSYNVSSITDNGTGDYTVNFATPMDNANYSASFSGQDGIGGAFIIGAVGGQWNTSGVRFTHRTASNLFDSPILVCQVFGGKV